MPIAITSTGTNGDFSGSGVASIQRTSHALTAGRLAIGPQGQAGKDGTNAALPSCALIAFVGQGALPGTTLVGSLTLAPGVVVTVVRIN